MNIELAEEERIFKDGCPYKNGLHELVVYYAKLPNPVELILKFQSIRSVVEGFYQVLTNHKLLEEIKSLPGSEKQRIWKMTEGLEIKERLKASKAIYLMEKIMPNSETNVQECGAT